MIKKQTGTSIGNIGRSGICYSEEPQTPKGALNQKNEFVDISVVVQVCDARMIHKGHRAGLKNEF
ncbi:MAG: hypothetical protein JWQ09_3678 [Segetibacter sp.]|nr:hypothetical protein [Segetibacter sp.]